jgi:hypothetical protein
MVTGLSSAWHRHIFLEKGENSFWVLRGTATPRAVHHPMLSGATLLNG